MSTTASADWLRPMSVRDMFESDSYRVPLYQRSYAWTEAEIHTLLRDIRDARLDSRVQAANHETRDYYIGSLVVNTERSAEGVVYEVVDGQQRLTTLFIILSVVPSILDKGLSERTGKLSGRLTFEGRAGAGDDLLRLARDGKSAIERLSTDGIRHAAGLVATAAERARDGVDERAATRTQPWFSAEDLGYLLDNVKILRSELPQGTDLNHYFEVMNTRGEQLEKHEILKSRLISALDDAVDRENFSQVWDACTVLDRHIQTQFPTKKVSGLQTSVRDRIFGRDWDRLTPGNGDELFGVLRDVREQTARDQVHEDICLSDVLTMSVDRADQGENGDEESDGSAYGAIIDFPNLLLHVLKVQQKESFSWASDLDDNGGEVRLEDKYLLSEFARVGHINAESVRNFAFLLLKTRFLMDTYVIRMQKTTAGDDEENWVLQRAFKYSSAKTKRQLSARSTFSAVDQQADDNLGDDASQRRVLMLQAMFQVTDTRRASKYFLYQFLAWLHSQEDSSRIDGEAFARHIESLAHDRLRALYTEATLHSGTHVPNFVFNVLDYELWRLVRIAGTNELDQLLGTDTVVALRKSASHFRFRYRTSVEHFYAVMPTAEQGHLGLPSELSNHFGNLCIMSRSENSRRNNLMPKAKAEEFASTGQSLKFQLMAELSLRAPEWNTDQIHTHGAEMVGVLEHALENEPDVLPW